MRVLVVEDDPLLGDALAVGLKQRAFEADWVQDGREAQTAMRVEPFAAVVLDLGLPGLSGAPVLHRYGRRVMFQVWKAGTVLSLHSQPTPNTPLSPIRDGFSDATIGGARWRVFSTWDVRDRVLVQVAEHVYERDELATAVARNFVVPLAIALPVLGVVIWAAVGRAMRSLTHVDPVSYTHLTLPTTERV